MVLENNLAGAAASWLMRCVFLHCVHSQPRWGSLKTLSSTTGAFKEQSAGTQVNTGVSSVLGLDTAFVVKISVYDTSLIPMDYELSSKSCKCASLTNT